MDRFTRAYAECALWSSTGDDDEFLDAIYGVDDLAMETVATFQSECADFIETAGDLLKGIDDTQAGHDFWLTRNRHGAGFWDRGLGEVGQKLTDLAQPYGEAWLYVGDDGLVYQG